MGKFDTFTIITDPVVCGDGIKRGRRYTFIWNPVASRFSGTEEDFKELAMAKPMVTGAMYQVDTDENRAKYHNKIARGHHHYGDQGLHTPIENLLTTSEAAIYLDVMKVHKERAGADGLLVTDLEQNAGFCSFGTFIPSLQKHGKLVTLNERGELKLFTPKEYLYMQGVVTSS